VSDVAINPTLKPRVETVPPVSEKALELFAQNLVWDNTLPWTSGSNSPDIDRILPRYHAVGVNYISVTMDVRATMDRTMAQIALTKRQVRERSDTLSLASTTAEIRAAQAAGKLALGLNLQDTLPYGTNLDNVQASSHTHCNHIPYTAYFPTEGYAQPHRRRVFLCSSGKQSSQATFRREFRSGS